MYIKFLTKFLLTDATKIQGQKVNLSDTYFQCKALKKLKR